MGALDRLKTDRNKNMLMSTNVTGTEYQEGFDLKQAITLGILGLLTLVGVLVFKDSKLATPIGWVTFVLILLTIYMICIRFLVIGETYLAKQTMQIKLAQDKVPADLWNIINIDDDGVIYYQDGRLGVIICAEQATIVGRPENYRSIHYSAISDFYKVLNQNNVQWMHINAMVNARTENRLSSINEKLRLTKNKSIRTACESHLAYLRNLEVRTLYEKEYWRLAVGSSFGKDQLLKVVEDASEYLGIAAFNRCTILPKEECYELSCQLLNLNSFDAQSIMIEKAQRIVSTPLGVIKQIKFNDNLSEEKIATIETALKRYNDKSEFLQLDDSSYQITLGTLLSNMLAQKLHFLIQGKHKIESGYIRTNCFNIKWVEDTNTSQENEKATEDDILINLENNAETTLFASQYTNAETEEDFEQYQQAQQEELAKVNAELLRKQQLSKKAAQEGRANLLKQQQKERAEQLARQKEEQEKLEAQRKAEAEREAKKMVIIDDLVDDEE